MSGERARVIAMVGMGLAIAGAVCVVISSTAAYGLPMVFAGYAVFAVGAAVSIVGFIRR